MRIQSHINIHSGRIRAFILIIIACVFSLLFARENIHISEKIGRLSTVPNYDDVVYLSKAAQIYSVFKEKGIYPGIKDIFTMSLHAPFTVYDGLLGFSIFGFNINRIYYSQIVVLLIYLAFTWYFIKRLPESLIAVFFIFSLAIPFATLCILVFRPDQLSGVVVGGGILAILTFEDFFEKWKNSMIFGCIAGFALLIKSSTFALVILVFFGAWCLTAFRSLVLNEANLKKIALSAILLIFFITLVAGWYWVQHAQELWAYFIDNSFGCNKNVWRLPGDFKKHLLYYFSGDALQSSLGNFIIPIIIIILTGFVYDLFFNLKVKERIISFNVIFLMICIFTIYYLQGIKNQYMGAVLYMYIFYTSIFYIGRVLNNLNNKKIPYIQPLVAVIILAASLMLYQFPNTERINQVQSSNTKITTLGVLKDVLQQKNHKQTRLLMTQALPVVSEYISMVSRLKSYNISISSVYLEKNLQNIVSLLPGYDFVVVQDQGVDGRPGFPIPAEIWEGELKIILDKDSNWSLVSFYSTKDGKKVYLYKNKSNI